MEFCSIDYLDDSTVTGLLHVYAETTADLFEKDFAGHYDNEEKAHAAQAQDYAHFIASFIAQDDRYIFALREDGVIAAALRVIHLGGDNWYLEALGTAPQYRAQGCARRLLTKTLRCMRVLCANSIVSVVRKDNAASRAVHEACGFSDTGDAAKDMEGTVIEECRIYRYIYANRT